MTSDPFDAAARALRHADRSRRELELRLERAGTPASEREAALARLEQLGWLDDARTALTRAEALAARGYVNAYIRAELDRRGLPHEEALEALEPEAARSAHHAARGPGWLRR